MSLLFWYQQSWPRVQVAGRNRLAPWLPVFIGLIVLSWVHTLNKIYAFHAGKCMRMTTLWSDWSCPHSRHLDNAGIAMISDPSSLVKGLAPQTSTFTGSYILSGVAELAWRDLLNYSGTINWGAVRMQGFIQDFSLGGEVCVNLMIKYLGGSGSMPPRKFFKFTGSQIAF